MQHLFSWTQYMLFSITIVVLYYTVVLFKFYRKELFRAGFSKSKMNPPTFTTVGNHFGESVIVSKPEASNDNLTATVHEFVYELKTLLQQLAAQKEEKTEVMNAAKKLVNKYQILKGSQFKPGLVNLVAAETATICGVHLDTDDLLSLWK